MLEGLEILGPLGNIAVSNLLCSAGLKLMLHLPVCRM